MRPTATLVILTVILISVGWMLNVAYNSIEYVAEPDGIRLQPTDREGPGNRITGEIVRVYENRVILDLNDVSWSELADTNSMAPILDSQSHTLEIMPISSSDVKVGDIISFMQNDDRIIHRIIEIGYDKMGWYAYTKGDNVLFRDADKVRFDAVTGVVVGILY